MNVAPDARKLPLRLERLAQRKTLRAIAEVLVVGICTLAFVLTAAGICVSLLGKAGPGSRDPAAFVPNTAIQMLSAVKTNARVQMQTTRTSATARRVLRCASSCIRRGNFGASGAPFIAIPR